MASAGASAAGAQRADKLCPGARIEVVGLKTRTELNNHKGILGAFDRQAERWQVDVRGVGFMKIKEENLRLVSDAKSSRKLCRYGQTCWRPCCHFVHDNEYDRAQSFADLWLAKLSANDHGKQIVPTSSGNDVLAQQLPISLPCVDDINEKLAQIEKDVAGIQARFEQQKHQPTVDAQEQMLTLAANVDDLTDLSAQKYCELDMRLCQDSARIENYIAKLTQKVETCVAQTGVDSQLPERIWEDVASRVDERVTLNMRDLLQETLRGALVPLAENFQSKMAEFESRVMHHDKGLHDT